MQRASFYNRAVTVVRALGGRVPWPNGFGNWFSSGVFSRRSHSGKVVNASTAMRTATVFACVRVVQETMASLPMHVYENVPRGSRVLDAKHPLQRLLHVRPCPELSAYEFWELMHGHIELRGNALAEIEWSRDGRWPVALWPLHPDRVRVFRDKSGLIMYEVTCPDGTRVPLPSEHVLHIRSFTEDGIWGKSPIEALAQTIGLQLAAEEFGARVFDGDGMMRMALQTDQVIKDDKTIQDLKKTWGATAGGGLENSHRLSILHSGLKPINIGINPKDAQLLELMSATRADIIRAYRLPPHKVGDMTHATFGNIEHQSIEFRQDSCLPRATRVESALHRCVLKFAPQWYVRSNLDALQRGDLLSRMQAHAVAIQNSILMPNEVRELEDRNPHPLGDVLYRPLNWVQVGAEEVLPQRHRGHGGGEGGEGRGQEFNHGGHGDHGGKRGRGGENHRGDSGGSGHGPGCCGHGHGENHGGDAGGIGEGGEGNLEGWKAGRGDGQRQNAAAARVAQVRASGKPLHESIRRAWQPVIREQVQRVYTRWGKEIAAGVRRHLYARDAASWEAWVEEFLGRASEEYKAAFVASVGGMANQIAEAAAGLLGAELPTDVDSYARAIVESKAKFGTGYAREQLLAISRAIGEDAVIEDLISSWSERSGEWSNLVSNQTVVVVDSDVSRRVWEQSGVLKLQWVASGGEVCPICQRLNGRVVGIKTAFVAPGEKVEGGEGQSDFEPVGSVLYPPLHDGCVCSVVPVV